MGDLPVRNDPEIDQLAPIVRQIREVYSTHGARELVARALRHAANAMSTDDGPESTILLTLVSRPDPVIVDAGAATGVMTERFLNLYPDATVFAFEPIPENVETLRTKFGDAEHVRVEPFVLSDRDGEGSFTVYADRGCSSVLSPVEDSEGLATDHEIRREYRRLDTVQDGPIDILKLDVQGYERHVLDGASSLLDDIRVIQTEVNFARQYQKQVDFPELHGYLDRSGFELFNIVSIYSDDAGRGKWGDAVYVNRSLISTSQNNLTDCERTSG